MGKLHKMNVTYYDEQIYKHYICKTCSMHGRDVKGIKTFSRKT
jgi:hypothetical protein